MENRENFASSCLTPKPNIWSLVQDLSDTATSQELTGCPQGVGRGSTFHARNRFERAFYFTLLWFLCVVSAFLCVRQQRIEPWIAAQRF
jgi:hypothetical protein